jgi:hypothetical protein
MMMVVLPAWEVKFRLDSFPGAWSGAGFMKRWNLVVTVKPAIDNWSFRTQPPIWTRDYSHDQQSFGYYVNVLKNICADAEVQGNYTWWCNMHQDW